MPPLDRLPISSYPTFLNINRPPQLLSQTCQTSDEFWAWQTTSSSAGGKLHMVGNITGWGTRSADHSCRFGSWRLCHPTPDPPLLYHPAELTFWEDGLLQLARPGECKKVLLGRPSVSLSVRPPPPLPWEIYDGWELRALD